VPWVPLLAILFCAFLMTRLEKLTWIAFIIWLAVGLTIYFVYSRRHSSLNTQTTVHLDQ
jgi:APA family basic amino acid/polyamine antiporter